jgi:hypothetical protein
MPDGRGILPLANGHGDAARAPALLEDIELVRGKVEHEPKLGGGVLCDVQRRHDVGLAGESMHR